MCDVPSQQEDCEGSSCKRERTRPLLAAGSTAAAAEGARFAGRGEPSASRHPMAAAAAGGARPFSKPVSATNTSRCIAQGPSGSTGITTTTRTKADAAAPTEVKSDDYTEEMQAKMGTTLTYRHVQNLFKTCSREGHPSTLEPTPV